MNRILFAASLALAGCSGGGSSAALDGPCGDMCRELVQDCSYAAFPTVESCYEGCLWADENGGQITEQQACVEQAECNTFAIVECEHAYGAY